MSDFTKEQLGVLSRALTCYVGENAGKDIQDKLRHMIDNYCEHKSLEMDCDGGISLVCTDCNHTVMDI